LDDTLHCAMDFEFFVRLASRGYRFKHIPLVLADFRFQPDSKSSRMPSKQLDEVNAVMEHYSPLSSHLRTVALRSVGFSLLRSTAAALRYLQKLSRGYYFDRFRRSAVRF
jgi:hypothetical protein